MNSGKGKGIINFTLDSRIYYEVGFHVGLAFPSPASASTARLVLIILLFRITQG